MNALGFRRALLSAACVVAGCVVTGCVVLGCSSTTPESTPPTSVALPAELPSDGAPWAASTGPTETPKTFPWEPPDAPMPSDEAMERAIAYAKLWDDAPSWRAGELRGYLSTAKVEPIVVRRTLESLTSACLAQRSPDAPECDKLDDANAPESLVIPQLFQLLGEVDASPLGPGRTMQLLTKLDARGLWRADSTIERILERQAMAALANKSCKLPSAEQIAAAEDGLADFVVIDGPSRARKPTSAERADLAYLYAALADAGAEIGQTAEAQAQPLPDDHPDNDRRRELRVTIDKAFADGDITEHAAQSERYLATLGYPGPLRLGEEKDMRWGGSGASFLMRDLARSLEILGRFAESEALHRRAKPGGGMCGTSVYSRLNEQIEGVIRTGEQARGCLAAVPDRLFADASDLHDSYGPEWLTSRGLDVPRLYRGALLTLGRTDRVELEKTLDASSFAAEGRARLERVGLESWGRRVRAIPGYADTAGGASADRLLAIILQGQAQDRVEALDALSMVLEDDGYDPCLPRRLHGFHRYSGGGRRNVRNVMTKCATRVDAATVERVVAAVLHLHKEPDHELRERLATFLGRVGSMKAKATLKVLATDRYENGEICESIGDGPSICSRHFPVARAAKNALERLAKTQKNRAANKP